MRYNRGDIVWVKFPFTDASSTKLRPALIISNSAVNVTGDYLLMQLTSRLHEDRLSLPINNSDFAETELLKQSELRVHKVFVLHHTLIANKLTSVKPAFLKSVIDRLICELFYVAGSRIRR